MPASDMPASDMPSNTTMPSNTMTSIPQLPGYHIKARIYAGKRTLVYRGATQHGQPVIIKVLRDDLSAEALQDLGKQRVIHKDIKPSNILIHPETHHIQLIDLSLSSLLSKEQQPLTNLTVLEGTLAYLSP